MRREGNNNSSIQQNTEPLQEKMRKSRRSSSDSKRQCFLCLDIRSSDNNAYNEGGLGRCEMTKAQERLIDRSKYYIDNSTNRFHEAANRFNILRNGQSFDNFAIDIYYHKSCYIKFAINSPAPSDKPLGCNVKDAVSDVMNDFYRTIRIRIIKNKEAYLLHHLHSYLKMLCDEYGIEPVYEHSVSLKRELLRQFRDDV